VGFLFLVIDLGSGAGEKKNEPTNGLLLDGISERLETRPILADTQGLCRSERGPVGVASGEGDRTVLLSIRWLKLRGWHGVLIAGSAGAATLIPLIYLVERFSLSMGQDQLVFRTGPPQPFAQVESAGLFQPPTSGVEGSGMRDDDEVIGVVGGGRARAYRLDALRPRTHHVVNDLVGGVPITVAYCDLTECVRGYTDPQGHAPLGFSVGGLYIDEGSQMVVKLDGVFYFHKSGKPIKPGPGSTAMPYELIEPTRTTWKEWVRRHPETDVYTGDRKEDRK
jgi:hypothetical protein